MGWLAKLFSPTPKIEQADLVALLESSSAAGADRPLILDVRSAEEFDAGHLPGALNIPHTELPSRLDEILTAKGRLTVVY